MDDDTPSTREALWAVKLVLGKLVFTYGLRLLICMGGAEVLQNHSDYDLKKSTLVTPMIVTRIFSNNYALPGESAADRMFASGAVPNLSEKLSWTSHNLYIEYRHTHTYIHRHTHVHPHVSMSPGVTMLPGSIDWPINGIIRRLIR